LGVPESDLSEHFDAVVDLLMEGELIPFLGAGVNRCGRPPDVTWGPSTFLPDGGELSRHLAEEFRYPAEDQWNLLRVAQFVALMRGERRLYSALHKILADDYAPTAVHTFFASVPRALRARGCKRPCQVIITTNYDDLMEQALREAGEPFDVLWYITTADESTAHERGKFWYLPHDGTRRLIESPNQSSSLPIGERTLILKIHGAVDRGDVNGCSFVITEDDYIDYLARMGPQSLLPADLAEHMKLSGILFMGYSLADWNMRVLLRRIWDAQRLSTVNWAIQLRPRELDRRYWGKYENVQILDVDLKEYVDGLAQRLGPFPAVLEAV
jgi:hypothetical protein